MRLGASGATLACRKTFWGGSRFLAWACGADSGRGYAGTRGSAAERRRDCGRGDQGRRALFEDLAELRGTAAGDERGVMGDQRTYAYTAAVRAVHSEDGMTADWTPLPYEVLKRISSRIVNEVRGINRVGTTLRRSRRARLSGNRRASLRSLPMNSIDVAHFRLRTPAEGHPVRDGALACVWHKTINMP